LLKNIYVRTENLTVQTVTEALRECIILLESILVVCRTESVIATGNELSAEFQRAGPELAKRLCTYRFLFIVRLLISYCVYIYLFKTLRACNAMYYM